MWAIEQMTQDNDLSGRIRSAVAQEYEYGSIADPGDPSTWQWNNRYAVCVAPSWGEKYAYAVETGVERPGLDPGVITDDDIRSQVAAVQGPPPEAVPAAPGVVTAT